jgi:N6-adenosine-specific RNA methylase IME4
VETKTENIDIIILPGYKFVMKNREKNTKNRSGGIMVGFKDNLAKHIDIVNTDSKYVMWFKCSEQHIYIVSFCLHKTDYIITLY